MPRFPSLRPWLLWLTLASPARAQAPPSPYLPTDDPRLPLIEHLIARGEIRDPSPLERPFRRSDLLRELDRSSSPVATSLAGALAIGPKRRWSRLAVRLGPQGSTQGRRDLLQDGGDGELGAFAEAEVETVHGPVVFAGRAAFDTRLSHDPDYVYPGPGFPFLRERNGRSADLYLDLQAGWDATSPSRRGRSASSPARRASWTGPLAPWCRSW